MFWKVLGITCGVGMLVGIGIGCAVAIRDHKDDITATLNKVTPKTTKTRGRPRTTTVKSTVKPATKTA